MNSLVNVLIQVQVGLAAVRKTLTDQVFKPVNRIFRCQDIDILFNFNYIVIYVDEDNCVTATCLNNGQCIDQVAGYICSCIAGFTGDRCQTGKRKHRT